MPANFPTSIASLPSSLGLPPPPVTFDVTLTPPGSKSLTNRAMLLAGLASGTSTIRNALIAGEDSLMMRQGLAALGAQIHESPEEVKITGVNGCWPAANVALELGNSGTSVRFLAAAAALASGPITIDGSARMRERPIAELGNLLTNIGCTVEYLAAPGLPPLRITPPPASPAAAPTIDVGSFQSSQFISALLLVGSWFPRGLTLRLGGPVTSAAYIHMTLGLLTKLGALVRTSENLHVIRLGPGGGLQPFDYSVEPDATGATYFWAAGALNERGRCRILGLDAASLQGDCRFPEVLGRMGVKVTRSPGPDAWIETCGPRHLRPILADMSDMPDAAMTLAAVACFAEGTSILRGLRTLRVKECDRIAAMQAELTKLGVSVQSPVQNDPDAMTITPPPGGIDCSPTAPRVTFDTYDDHRIAMSLALIALRRPNITINKPACVAKTYPTFWQDFAKLYT